MNPETPNNSVEVQEIPKSIELEKLISILYEVKIPLDSWGDNNTKTVNHLFGELKNGESKLFKNNLGEVERHIDIAMVEIIHIAEFAVVYGLKEEKQVFKDGRVIERQLSTSIFEKIKAGEEPEDVGKRALTEKLGINQTDSFLEFRHGTDSKESQSYPGLKTNYNTYPFMAMVDVESFNQDGYIEEREDKTIYYVWDYVND